MTQRTSDNILFSLEKKKELQNNLSTAKCPPGSLHCCEHSVPCPVDQSSSHFCGMTRSFLPKGYEE